MASFVHELDAGGVDYRPVTFSCYGLPHPDAVRLFRALGRRLARRKGTEAHIEERRLAACVGVEVWRRAARMLRACLPDTAEDEAEATLTPLSEAILRRVGPSHTVETETFER